MKPPDGSWRQKPDVTRSLRNQIARSLLSSSAQDNSQICLGFYTPMFGKIAGQLKGGCSHVIMSGFRFREDDA